MERCTCGTVLSKRSELHDPTESAAADHTHCHFPTEEEAGLREKEPLPRLYSHWVAALVVRPASRHSEPVFTSQAQCHCSWCLAVPGLMRVF